jgi:ribosomal-protein-alanine N-acetyltransferase
MTISLRQGGLADLEAVYRLNKENFSEYWSRQSLFSALESGYDLLLCESDGQSVGYVLSLTILDEIQIMQIAVSPNYRRGGIASRMTEMLMTVPPHVCTVTLEVRAANHAARNLYAGLGFEQVGYRKNYYAPDINGNREDAVLMTRQAQQ